MKKKILVVLFSFLLLVVCTAQQAPEPAHCAICDGIPYHAPCIINLSTGEVVELAIYEPHFSKGAELAENQRGGYFSLVHQAGVSGYMEGAKYIEVSFLKDSPKMDPQYFCNVCRERFSACAGDGYVLVDLKDLEHPTVLTAKLPKSAAPASAIG